MRRFSNPPPHVYGGQRFDRAARGRSDNAWLAGQRRHPASRVLLMSGLKVMVLDGADPPCAFWLTVGDLDDELDDRAIFLGADDQGVSAFALDLGGRNFPDARYVELRSVGGLLPSTEAGLLAYTRGLVFWHQRHLFCGACGAATRSEQGGHVRRCTGCGAQHFPRSDPAVIVLVTHAGRGERCLLWRSARFPGGMYSTLAGFVEPGESLEETVARELYEEAGIDVTDVTYCSSQPWPFPASLMLGFRARALSDHLQIDRTELEDAAWFTREELLDPINRPVKLPNRDSIARHLIEAWLLEG